MTTPETPTDAGRPAPDGVPAMIEALSDTRSCPNCASPLTAAVCSVCGVDLTGPSGRRLFALSQDAVRVLRSREEVLATLRAAVPPRRPAVPDRADAGMPAPDPYTRAPAPPAPPAPPVSPGPTGPPGPVGFPPPAWPPPPPPARSGGFGVQGVLLTLGALLVSVFVLFFMAVAWSVLPLAGRAALIGLVTAVAIAGAWLLKSHLEATAEAIAAIAVVLLLIDAWAVHRLGFLGADAIDGPAYTAGATAVLAVLIGAWAAASRLRVPLLSAVVLAPSAPVIAGLAVAADTHRARDVALGFLGASVVAAGRRLLPERFVAERVLLVLAGVGGIGSAAVGIGQEAADEHLLTVMVLLALCAAATALQGLADGPLIWAPVAGAFAAAAVVPGVIAFARGTGLDDRDISWPLILVPAVVALTLPVAALAGRRRAPGVMEMSATPLPGAVAVLVAVFAPVAAVAAAHVGQAAGAGVPPWQLSLSASVGRAGRTGGASVLSADAALDTWPVAVLAGVLALAVGLLARRAGGRAVPVGEALAMAGLGAAAVLVPLAPRLPLAASVLGLVTVAVCATLGAATLRDEEHHRPHRAAAVVALAVAALAGVLAVLLSWVTQWLSVPVTVLGVIALLLARAALAGAHRIERAVLAAAAGAAGLVALAGGVRWIGPSSTALVVAGVAGALLAAAALSRVVTDLWRRPTGLRLGRPWVGLDRWLVAAVGVVAVLVALSDGWGAWDDASDASRADLQVLLGGLLLGVILVAARPHPVLVPPGPAVAGQTAAVVTSFFAGSLCVGLAATTAVFVIGLVLSAAAVALVVRGRAVSGALALRLRVRGSFAALAYRCGIGAALAATLNAVDGPGGRVDELWTLPLGLVLVAAGAVRLARDPALRSWQTLAPGLLVLLAPPLWLSLVGDEAWRPAFVLVLGGAVVVAGAVRRLQAPLLLGAGVLVLQVLVLLGPYLGRAVVLMPPWITGGLVGLTLLTLGAMYELCLTTARLVRRSVLSLR